MKILQWILSKTLLVVLVAAVGAGYYYRAELFPQWFPKAQNMAANEQATDAVKSEHPEESGADTTTQQQASDEPEPQETAVSSEIPATQAAPVQEGDTTPSISQLLESANTTPVIQQEAPVEPAQESGQDIQDMDSASTPAQESVASGPAQTGSEQPVESTGLTADMADNVDVADIPATLVAQNETSPATNSTTSDSNELISLARTAFWKGDHSQAETAYKQAADNDPDNPDIYGELGNIYFSQGKWESAAKAFYEAGVRLIKQGETARARHMVIVLKGLDVSMADKLEKAITE